MFKEIAATAAKVVARVKQEMTDEGSSPAEVSAVKFTGQIFAGLDEVYYGLSIPGSWDGIVYVTADGRGSLEGSDVKRLLEAAL